MKKHQNKPLRILVVDDDIDLLMLMERILTKAGYNVESAASLPEAEYVQSMFHPHLVLIDINIAGCDGRQLCWKIKHDATQADTKVVLMSGTSYPTSKVLLFGADDFIAKPFQSEYVLQKTEDLLSHTVQEPVVNLPLWKKAI